MRKHHFVWYKLVDLSILLCYNEVVKGGAIMKEDKLEISLKETNETSKWIEMLWKSNLIDEQKYKDLDRKCSTIRFLLVKSITTAKNHLNK